MRIIELDELKGTPGIKEYMGWLPPWMEEALMNCFQFMALELKPFEKFNSDGGACLLINGQGRIGEKGAQVSTWRM